VIVCKREKKNWSKCETVTEIIWAEQERLREYEQEREEENERENKRQIENQKASQKVWEKKRANISIRKNKNKDQRTRERETEIKRVREREAGGARERGMIFIISFSSYINWLHTKYIYIHILYIYDIYNILSNNILIYWITNINWLNNI